MDTLFSGRQMLFLLTFAANVQATPMPHSYSTLEHSRAVLAYLGLLQSTICNANSSLCRWIPQNQQMGSVFSRQAFAMNWDYCEIAPLGGASGDTEEYAKRIVEGIEAATVATRPANVARGSATNLPWSNAVCDVVITDPPYYDNIDYAKLSDFFYVWLKRCLGSSFPEHFAAAATPKKQEAVADPVRHGRDRAAARRSYETMMAQAFVQASRVLKDGGHLVVVYAHKTTLGWATLVDSLRTSGFLVSEAWPLDTEKPGRVVAQDSAALTSSIFLVARKRQSGAAVGYYEEDVQPELTDIVREKVDVLWEMGITGADLVIAAVGAGLQAFTKYDKVEYANGEEVPAEKFLAEVEAVVLNAMLAKLSGAAGGNVSTVDNVSRFYVLWRFVYKTAELDAGEAIVFSNGTHIELDGPLGLSTGKDAMVEKKKAKYRARDFTERGNYDKLGLPTENGQSAPLIDTLHRILWLMENSPRKLGEFLDEARPDRERLRVLAQALAGAALSGKSETDAAKLVSTTTAEQTALGKLLANWRSLIEEGAAAAVVGKKAAKQDKEDGQGRFDYGRADR